MVSLRALLSTSCVAAWLGLPTVTLASANAQAPADRPASPPAAFVITHARLVDGTGSPARMGAVRVVGDRIVAVGKVLPQRGDVVVDANGLVLAPGFIDTHSHDVDSADLTRPNLATSPDGLTKVSQGVTTTVFGQDGRSIMPVWLSLKSFETHPAAINVAQFVGFGAVRQQILGMDQRRPATADEIVKMRALVAQSMREGALGMSAGLEYDPDINSTTGELTEVAREVALQHGRLHVHIRNEDVRFFAALDEIVQVARDAHVPVGVTHIKLAAPVVWGQADRATAFMDKARKEGIDVYADVYPYTFWQTSLHMLFPARRYDLEEAHSALDVTPADRLRLAIFRPDPTLVGKTVAEIAAMRHVEPAEALLALVRETPNPRKDELVLGTAMQDADVATFILWPNAGICSDGSLFDAHPRGAGTFTRVLREYVREKHLLTLEQAVRKMTSLSASHMGITDRGRIAPGMAADLVLFDPATVSDRSTIENSTALSVGIARVWVNGTLVFEDGRATGARPGRVLRSQVYVSR